MKTLITPVRSSLELSGQWRAWLLGFLFVGIAGIPSAQCSDDFFTARFSRGTGDDATYHSFVIPLDEQAGVPFHPTEARSSNERLALQNSDGSAYWLFETPAAGRPTLYQFDNTNGGRFPVKNPVVAFGTGAGAPLLAGRTYRYGVYAGGRRVHQTLHDPCNDCEYVHKLGQKVVVGGDLIVWDDLKTEVPMNWTGPTHFATYRVPDLISAELNILAYAGMSPGEWAPIPKLKEIEGVCGIPAGGLPGFNLTKVHPIVRLQTSAAPIPIEDENLTWQEDPTEGVFRVNTRNARADVPAKRVFKVPTGTNHVKFCFDDVYIDSITFNHSPVGDRPVWNAVEESWHEGIRVRAFSRSTLQEISSSLIKIPKQPRLGEDTTEWDEFVQRGYQVRSEENDLVTTVESVRNGQAEWGVDLESPYVISHTATSANCYYLVEAVGLVIHQGNRQPLVTKGPSIPNPATPMEPSVAAAAPLYTLEFREPLPVTVTFEDAPQFQSEPVPPAYLGKTVAELTNVQAAVETPSSLPAPGAVPSAYTKVDTSIELWRHPVLDEFVKTMKGDPLSIANFVQNEIDLVGAFGMGRSVEDTDEGLRSVPIETGINRGAVATFLERQGTPFEQCALLVYLLRQAGYPAVYVVPRVDGVKMLDSRFGDMIGMQLRAWVNEQGVQYTDRASRLVRVGYPWVCVAIDGQWVNLYPWIKDVEIVEGRGLYDIMPQDYDTGEKLIRKYIYGDTALTGLAEGDDDTMRVILPKFIDEVLAGSIPGSTAKPGVSIEDIGIRRLVRKNHATSWDAFPRPFSVDVSAAAVLEHLGQQLPLDGTPRYQPKFNSMDISVSEAGAVTPKVAFKGMPVAALQNRRCFISYDRNGTGAHGDVVLNLAPFRPGLGTIVDDPADKQFQATPGELTVGHRTRFNHASNKPLELEVKYHYFPSLNLLQPEAKSVRRPVRSGMLSAVCFNTGRVTREMTAQHAEVLWNYQRWGQENAKFRISNEEFYGAALYLLGMNYFERVSRFQRQCMDLHKAAAIEGFNVGTARFSAATGVVEPSVDMIFNILRIFPLGNVRADLNHPKEGVLSDAILVWAAAFSAEEHGIINSFFGQSEGLSTVKVLQTARKDVTDENGNLPPNANDPGIVELNTANFTEMGAKGFGHSGALMTREFEMWESIETALGNPETSKGSFALLNTRRVRAGKNPKKRSAAFIADRTSVAAYISGLNGGFGVPVSLPPDTSSISLSATSGGGYFLDLGAPRSVSLYSSTPVSMFDTPNYLSNFNNNASFSDIQSYTFNSAVSAFDLSGGNAFGAAAEQIAEAGFLGSTSYYGDQNVFVADPVSVQTGEFYVNEVDIKLPGQMPIELRRTYSSLACDQNQLGFGWKLGYMPYISLDNDEDNAIFAAEPDGSVIKYTPDGTDRWTPSLSLDDNPSLHNPKADALAKANPLLHEIVKTNSETYELRTSEGHVRTYKMRSFPIIGNKETLTRNRPYLTQWTDAQGNHCRFIFGEEYARPEYGQMTAVESSNGASLHFVYDVYGRITNAFSHDGRRVEYHYDDFGDLRKVVRPDGSEVAYDYLINPKEGKKKAESTHLISRERKPEGWVVENSYDRNANDPNPIKKERKRRRVTEQRSSVHVTDDFKTSPTLPVTARFAYDQTLTLGLETYTDCTFVTDVNNQVTKYVFRENMMRATISPTVAGAITGQSTTQQMLEDWSGFGEVAAGGLYPRSVKSRTNARGLVTTYKYDGRGNLTEMREEGDLDGSAGNEVAITKLSYDEAGSVVDATPRDLLTSIEEPPAVGALTGRKTRFKYLSSSYPRLPTNSSQYAANGTKIGELEWQYGEKIGEDFQVFGLKVLEVRSPATSDETRIEFGYDERGFMESQVRLTGTSEPALVSKFRHNERGERIEEKDPSGVTKGYDYDAMGRRKWTEVRDANDQLLSWNYDYFDGNGNLTWSDGPRFNPEDYVWREYDGAGRPLRELRWRTRLNADGTGIEAEGGFDPTAGNALFATTASKHDDFGNLVRTRDARGNEVSMGYDFLGRMTSRIAYQGTVGGTVLSSEKMEYNAAGDLIKQRNIMGIQANNGSGEVRRFYTSRGTPSRQENADGSVQEWRYRPDGRLASESRNGVTWTYQYVDEERRVRRSLNGTTYEETITDSRGNEISKRDVDGHVSTQTYDDLDRPLAFTGPPLPGSGLSRTTTNVYETAARKQRSINSGGEETVQIVDALGRPVEMTQFASDGTISNRVVTQYSVDHHSAVTTTGIGADAKTVRAFSDLNGKVLLTEVLKGGTVTERTFSTYDRGGYLTSTTDNRGKTTHSVYDALGRPKFQSLPNDPQSGRSIDYQDAAGIIVQTMPGGLKSQQTFDAAGRMVEDKDISGTTAYNTLSFGYYSSGANAGQLDTSTDARNVQRKVTQYDDFFRPKQVTLARNGSTEITTDFTRDGRGNVLELAQVGLSSATKINRTYDGYGSVRTEEARLDDNLGDGLSYVLVSNATQGWDLSGRRSSLSLGATALSSNVAYSYGYRADGRLTEVIGNSSYRFNYDYGTDGRIRQRRTPWRKVSYASYDPAGHLLSRETSLGSNIVLNETISSWQGDKLGSYQLTQTGTGAINRSVAYSYNDRGQMTDEAWTIGGNPVSRQHEFDFGSPDGIGVRTKVTSNGTTLWKIPSSTDVTGSTRVTKENSSTIRYQARGVAEGATSVAATLDGAPLKVSYEGPGRNGVWTAELELASRVAPYALAATATHNSTPAYSVTASANANFTVSAVPGAGTDANAITNILYDNAGNVTQRDFASGRSQVFTWDALGHLIQITQTGTLANDYVWSAIYDGLGRRLQSKYVRDGQTRTEQSWYDPAVEFLELGVAIDGRLAWKFYGPDANGGYGALQGIGGLEGFISADGISSGGFVDDLFGNVLGTIDGDGLNWSGVIADAYGNALRSNIAPLDAGLRFADSLAWRGRRPDPTGFYMLGTRYYDSAGVRFLSPDPLGHDGADSLYSYANGDPVNMVDPDGRFGVSSYPGSLSSSWQDQELALFHGSYYEGADSGSIFDGLREWLDGPSLYAKSGVETIDPPTKPLTIEEITSAVFHAIPIIGGLISLYEAHSGEDVFTGERVDQDEALMNAAMNFAFSATMVPYGQAARSVSGLSAGEWLATQRIYLAGAEARVAGMKVAEVLPGLQLTVKELAETHLLPTYRALDPNLKAGFTGSFKTGFVGNETKPTYGQSIDLSKFDIDYWIESDVLFEKYGTKLKADVQFRKILSETPGFEGLKPNKKGFSIKFKKSSN